jgi:hypothetical protein
MNIHVRKSLTVLAFAASTWPLAAQTAAPAPAAKPAAPLDEEAIVLSPFEVSSQRDTGYQATETLAGTRIRTDLKDVASSIQVITKEFLQDVGATNSGNLLQYTTNAEVAGTRGTYAGLGNGTSVDETSTLRNPSLGSRVRGLDTPDNTRDFFVTDIPWDGYNVDRIDIQRGPNAILFGLGSPAGIINASIHNAEFRDLGSVETRIGSYGTFRSSIDLNQELIPQVLAIRVDGLWNDQKYEQKQAWQNDKRFSGAVRFDPQLFKDRTWHTSIKAKYENGDIKSDRPRIIPPSDSITPWFRPVDNSSMNGGLNKLAVNYAYGLSAQPQNTNPWLTAGSIANQQQPLWLIDGTTNETYRITAGYVNNGFIDNTGAFRGVGNSALGQTYSDQFYGLTSLQQFAINAKLPGYQLGQYRQQSLTDPTVFDFYDNLIDGPTKSEFEKWNAYNIDLSQTAYDDRVGVEFSYDRQKYKRGGQALLGNPAISIDLLQHFQDLSVNPNFGRPYIATGAGGGSSYESDRKYIRGSLFGELRATDFFDPNSFIAKLLGKHRFNGVYSDEKYYTENRSWQQYANSVGWDGYWNRNDGTTNAFTNRSPVSVIYLGSSVAGLSTASGANISGITAPVTLASGNVYHFNSTWLNNGKVPSAAWVPPSNLDPIFPAATPPTGGYTEASNPANYAGWGYSFVDNLTVDNYDSNPSLTTLAQKSLRETKSYAGSWQGFLWNDAIVPTLGWRYDEVKGKAVTAAAVTANRAELNLQPNFYKLPDEFPVNQIFKNHSTSGGIVVHLNKLLDKHDFLPINISLSYDKSNNFQVTDVRHDVYGRPIANPTGETKEYGVLLSTKDNKYSLHVIKYDTSVANATAPLDLKGLADTVVAGLKFRNVFLYQMSNYTWASREEGYGQTLSPGNRHFWTPAYVTSAGRPVADLNGAGGNTSGTTLETQAQADTHRDASINAWNDIQKFLDAKGFFPAWNFTPTTLSALTDRATYAGTLTTAGSPDGLPWSSNTQYRPDIATLASYGDTRPPGLAVTGDTQSKGYEFEFTANPLPNWRISLNAAKTTAVRSNVGGSDLDALVTYMDQQMAGVAGDMRQFNGNYVAGNEVRQNWANWRGQYTLLKLQEGADASELRKWRYNVITNYTFTHGFLKGAGVGGGYRWQDKVVIGYPVLPDPANPTVGTFDLTKPYYGPSEDALDLWVSYERKLTTKINWRIQLNVYNVGKNDKLIPISVEPDGHTWAAARIAPVQEWQLTNTFSF